MKPKVIKKYEGTPFITALECFRELKHEYEKSDCQTHKLKATAIYYRIVGYTRALLDCEIVTEKEYNDLFAYYALMPSEEKEQS